MQFQRHNDGRRTILQRTNVPVAWMGVQEVVAPPDAGRAQEAPVANGDIVDAVVRARGRAASSRWVVRLRPLGVMTG